MESPAQGSDRDAPPEKRGHPSKLASQAGKRGGNPKENTRNPKIPTETQRIPMKRKENPKSLNKTQRNPKNCKDAKRKPKEVLRTNSWNNSNRTPRLAAIRGAPLLHILQLKVRDKGLVSLWFPEEKTTYKGHLDPTIYKGISPNKFGAMIHV